MQRCFKLFILGWLGSAPPQKVTSKAENLKQLEVQIGENVEPGALRISFTKILRVSLFREDSFKGLSFGLKATTPQLCI